MNFITGFSISANLKSDSYNLIFVIVYQLTKIIYYMLVKVMIDVPDLAEVIINVIVCYYGVLKSIVTDQDLFFIFKF